LRIKRLTVFLILFSLIGTYSIYAKGLEDTTLRVPVVGAAGDTVPLIFKVSDSEYMSLEFDQTNQFMLGNVYIKFLPSFKSHLISTEIVNVSEQVNWPNPAKYERNSEYITQLYGLLAKKYGDYTLSEAISLAIPGYVGNALQDEGEDPDEKEEQLKSAYLLLRMFIDIEVCSLEDPAIKTAHDTLYTKLSTYFGTEEIMSDETLTNTRALKLYAQELPDPDEDPTAYWLSLARNDILYRKELSSTSPTTNRKLSDEDNLDNTDAAKIYAAFHATTWSYPTTDILEAIGSDYSVDTTPAQDTTLSDAYNSVKDSFKEYLNSNQSVVEGQSYLDMMRTFDMRTKMLYATTNLGNSVAPLTDEIDGWYKTRHANTYHENVLPAVLEVDVDSCCNLTAYKYLLYTLSELEWFTEAYIPAIAPKVLSANLTTAATDAEKFAVKHVYDGIEFIRRHDDSVYTWWTKKIPYQVDGEQKEASLQDIYQKLKDSGAFNAEEYYNVESIDAPFAKFFSTDDYQLSEYIMKGMIQSSTYIPMSTNVYSSDCLRAFDDEEFLEDFHYKFGMHRKALYMDNNVDAAVDTYNTGRMGELSVCRLKDLLTPERDIVLYVDDNFYNISELAELQDKAYSRIDNTEGEGDGMVTFKEWFTNLFSYNIVQIAKTAEVDKYLDKIQEKTAKYTEDVSKDKSNYFLDKDTIKKTLEEEEYSVMKSFAVLSGIYRDDKVYKMEQEQSVVDTPVFISSPYLAEVNNCKTYDKKSLYNYMLLKNLQAEVPIDYTFNVDLNSPVYMDIYGNILTESGVVVIPAASNATLHSSNYVPLTAGFLALYGKEFALPNEYENCTSILSDLFYLDDKTNTWQLQAATLEGTTVDISRLSSASASTLTAIKKDYEYNASTEGYIPFKPKLHHILEVMRGAPIEYIDKVTEGLTSSEGHSAIGIHMASRFEDLLKQITPSEQNLLVSVPNIAFLPGIEAIILLIVKIILVIMIIIMLVTIYTDIVSYRLSVNTFFKCVWTVILVTVTVTSIPLLFELTYTQANKALLQDEAATITMLNLEKRESGVEVGVTEVNTPELSTSMYLRLDSISLDWGKMIEGAIRAQTFETVEDVYADAVSESLVSNKSGIEVLNADVMYNVDTLFDSSDVSYQPTFFYLYQVSDEDTFASFYTPYYLFLDTLISRVNTYNANVNSYSFNTKTQRGGRIKSLGLITDYFTSTEFMEDSSDILGIAPMYGTTAEVLGTTVYEETDLEAIQECAWYNKNVLEHGVIDRYKRLDTYLRDFVNDNKDLLGKVSDETFLKVMALSAAIKYNQLFSIPVANAFEIHNISNDDILRLSVTDRSVVLQNSPLSYARFVYEVGSTPGVIVAAVLSVILTISSILKPLLSVFLFCLVFISLFVHKIVLRKKNRSLLGYVKLLCVVAGINLLYAVLLKCTLYIPRLGFTPTVNIAIQIVLQVVYLSLMLSVSAIVTKDWRELGYNKFREKETAIRENVLRLRDRTMRRFNMQPVAANNVYSDSAMTNVWQRPSDAQPQTDDPNRTRGANLLQALRDRQYRRNNR